MGDLIGELGCGSSCMSGTPAATIRATNSSESIVRELVLIVSMKDAAEYCTAHSVALDEIYKLSFASIVVSCRESGHWNLVIGVMHGKY